MNGTQSENEEDEVSQEDDSRCEVMHMKRNDDQFWTQFWGRQVGFWRRSAVLREEEGSIGHEGMPVACGEGSCT